MSELRPAAELAEKGSKPFPNESAEYRAARTKLLAEEIELRRHIQRVAALRRAAPGRQRGRRLSLPRRRRKGASALPTCSGGTTRSSPISGCTAPSASAPARCAPRSSARSTFPPSDIEQRVALAIIGRSPVSRQLEFARERGWSNLKFYQTRRRRFRARLSRPSRRRQRMGDLRQLEAPGRQGPAVLGRRGRLRDRRPGLRPASRARSDAAVEHPRLDAGRPRHRLVPQAGV